MPNAPALLKLACDKDVTSIRTDRRQSAPVSLRLALPLAVVTALLVGSGPTSIAEAANYTVLNTGDAGADTLRAAITAANGDPTTDDVITFTGSLAGQTIDLDSMLPIINKTTGSLTITGLGADQLTISGQDLHRIFFVNDGEVVIEDIALADGSAAGGQGGDFGDDGSGGGGGGLGAGGAVFVNQDGSVTLRNVNLADNSATGGDGGSFDNTIPLGGAGGGGGGLGGNGGDGGERGGGGGGGFGGNGADGPEPIFGFAGSGGGGLTADGTAALSDEPSGGAGGGAEGGDGGNQGSSGQNGQTYGGGGGGGFANNGGNGGDFGGGGGGDAGGGNGGFGGGGGGAGGGTSGTGGFGAGDGGAADNGGNGGDGLGGAVFVRSGGTLTFENVSTSGGGVTAGSGGTGVTAPENGANGLTAGSDFYWHGFVAGEYDVTFGGDENATITGSIGGVAGLIKTGDGTLTLSASNNYTGGTTVNQGKLVVNGSVVGDVTVANGAALGGNGTLGGLILNGTIAPGNSIGTTHVTGDATFNAGSTTEIEINDAGTTPGVNNDLVDVTGDVTINGGSVQVDAAAGTYSAGNTYTFITANSVTGTFDDITDNLAFFNASLIYGADNVSFELLSAGTDFASIGATPNQIAAGTYLDGLTPPSELQDILDELIPLTDAEVQRFLSQFTGAIYATLPEARLQHTSYYLALMSDRLRASLEPGAWLTDETEDQPPVVATATGDADLIIRGQSCCCPQRTAWATGYGLGGQAQTDGNADGFRYGLGGTQFAVQQSLSDFWNGALWADLAWSNVRGLDLNERADVQNYNFGGYLVGFDGCDYYIVVGGLGYNHGEVERRITIGPFSLTAEGQYDGWQANAYAERGLSLCRYGWTVQPYAALQYAYLRQGNITESGASILNLAVGGLDVHSLRGILGGRMARDVALSSGRLLTPELHASWMHEFLDTNELVDVGLAQISGIGFAVRGLDLGRDWATVGGGVSLQLYSGTRLFAGYDAQVNDHQVFHVGSGGVEYVW